MRKFVAAIFAATLGASAFADSTILQPGYQICFRTIEDHQICDTPAHQFDLNTRNSLRLLLKSRLQICATSKDKCLRDPARVITASAMPAGGQAATVLQQRSNKSAALKNQYHLCWSDAAGKIDCQPRQVTFSLKRPADVEFLATHSLLVCEPGGYCVREAERYPAPDLK